MPYKNYEDERAWKEKNHEKVRAYARKGYHNNLEKSRARRRAAYYNGNRIWNWLKMAYQFQPCMDCGGTFPYCAMQFDHRPGETKKFTIASRGCYAFNPKNLAEVKKEIDKCDFVCANCHSARTVERGR